MKASVLSNCPTNRICGSINISRFGASHGFSLSGNISHFGASHGSAFRFDGAHGTVFHSSIRHHRAEAAYARPKKPGLAPKRLICSWSVEAGTIGPTTFDLSVKNPNGGEEVTHRSPAAIMDEIAALDAESAEVLQTIRGLL